MTSTNNHEEVCPECKGKGSITISNLKIWNAKITRYLTLPGGQWGNTCYIDTINLVYVTSNQDNKQVVQVMTKKFKDIKCDAVDNYFYESPESQIKYSIQQEPLSKNSPKTYIDGYFNMQISRNID